MTRFLSDILFPFPNSNDLNSRDIWLLVDTYIKKGRSTIFRGNPDIVNFKMTYKPDNIFS